MADKNGVKWGEMDFGGAKSLTYTLPPFSWTTKKELEVKTDGPLYSI